MAREQLANADTMCSRGDAGFFLRLVYNLPLIKSGSERTWELPGEGGWNEALEQTWGESDEFTAGVWV